jgi:hypothetical protein
MLHNGQGYTPLDGKSRERLNARAGQMKHAPSAYRLLLSGHLNTRAGQMKLFRHFRIARSPVQSRPATDIAAFSNSTIHNQQSTPKGCFSSLDIRNCGHIY